MSWLVVALGLGLGVAPESDSPEQTVVLVARRTAVSPALTKGLAKDTHTLLGDSGVSLAMTPDAAMLQLRKAVSVKDSASCNGKKSCLAELGRQLKVPWVVLLSVAAIENELSIGLELLRVSDETVLETDSLLLPRKGKLDATQLSAFSKKVQAQLNPPPPPEVKSDEPKKDEPVVSDLTPKKTDEPLLPPPPPPPPAKSHAPSFVLGGAGVASLLAGAALLTVGAVSRGPLTMGTPGDDGRVRSPLTYTEAKALNDASTPLVFSGIGALALGAGLGTAAVLTW